MKVKLKSKRVIKRMLASGNYNLACMHKSTILNLQEVGLVNSYFYRGAKYYAVPGPHETIGRAFSVPKHFIGKVVRK